MTVTLYKSTDASAPTLTGQAGSLISLLDACLVNGYGSQPAAGWTKPFANSGNKGCYRNSAVTGTGYYLALDDSASGTGGAKEALMVGYTAMSAVATGTGAFPTGAQLSGGVICRKSNTADATARAWTLLADETVFYLFTETGDYIAPLMTMPVMFGDIFSYAASDPNRCLIIGRNAQNSSTASQECFSAIPAAVSGIMPLATNIQGHFMAASYTGAGGSIQVGKHIDHFKFCGGAPGGGANGTGTAGLSTSATVCIGGNYSANANQLSIPFPNAPDGGLQLSPIWIHHNGFVRGYLKGLWAPLHHLPLSHGDTVSGQGNMSGKSFLAIQILGYVTVTSSCGEVILETSNTWG